MMQNGSKLSNSPLLSSLEEDQTQQEEQVVIIDDHEHTSLDAVHTQDGDIDDTEETKEERSDSTKTRSKESTDSERDLIKIHETSSMRKQISYAIFALKSNRTISISAFSKEVVKAVTMAELLKLRLGMLHQETILIVGKREVPLRRDGSNQQ